jgi:hypothetical protein
MVESGGDLLTATDAVRDNPEQGTQNWYPEEYKEVVSQKGWESSGDALKSYTELEKTLGGRVKMPSPESSAEEIRAFYQKTGCPENPDGYEVSGLPEDMPEFLRNEDAENAMKQIAYDQGVSKQAFESIVRGFYEKAHEDLLASKAQGEKSLKEQHGDKYDEVLAIANRFFDSCSEDFCTLVKATGLANHPVFINEFSTKGKQTVSDTLIKGTATGEEEKGYAPSHINSPGQYETGDDEDSKKARAYFRARGHIYSRQD